MSRYYILLPIIMSMTIIIPLFTLLDPKGEIYVIVGTGGINFHKLIGKNSYIVNQQSSFFGHLNVDITNKGQVLTAKFIQNNGKVFDSFSITK